MQRYPIGGVLLPPNTISEISKKKWCQGFDDDKRSTKGNHKCNHCHMWSSTKGREKIPQIPL